MGRARVGGVWALAAAMAASGCEVHVGSASAVPPAPAQAPVSRPNPVATHPPQPAAPAAPSANPAIASQVAPLHVRPTRVKDAGERSRMEAYVRSVQPPEVRHSFRLASGQDVDCVPADKQPAAKQRVAASPPLHPPPAPPPPNGVRDAVARVFAVPETLPGRAPVASHGCPAGTVPIRRTTIDEVASFKTLADFHRKGRPPRQPSDRGSERIANFDPNGNPHEHAALWADTTNYGAHSFLNVWAPSVEVKSGSDWGEFSLAQVWVLGYGGSREYDALQSVEAGYQVWPDKFGDSLPHLFVYSTQDGYQATGCYEPCGKFVQTSNDVVIGSPITAAASASDGAQYDVELAWWLTGDGWWLFVNGEPIGYYPSSLYAADGLLKGAAVFGFGGEVINNGSAHPGRHTETQMGSGSFPGAGFAKAAYVRNVYYYDTPTTARPVTMQAWPDVRATCYDATSLLHSGNPAWTSYFFFGGPGYNSQCQSFQ